jgi:RNA polymerase sigma factor (sigma-70 family)
MISAIKDIPVNTETQKLIQELYEAYANKLWAYARKNYQVPEDEAMNLVYKTIFRIAEVKDRYSFENEQKRNAFVFKTFINYLRNYYRDNKSFENRHSEIELKDIASPTEDSLMEANPKLKTLQYLLDQMQDWERILLLMRGQGIPYCEISKFVSRPENQLKVYYARLKKKLLEDMNELLNKTSGGK